MKLGHAATVSFEKKFGIANSRPARQVATMAKIFQRSKCSMTAGLSWLASSYHSLTTASARRTRSASSLGGGASCILYRLALGAHVHERASQNAHLQSVGKLDLDL